MAGARVLTRAVTVFGGTALLATAAVTGTASPAGAAADGTIAICARGSYAASVELKGTHGSGWKSHVVQPGKCTSGSPGFSGRIEVYGHVSPSKFYIGSVDYRAGKSLVISTTGSSAAPDFVVNYPGGIPS
ncbi:hypothetical protein [Streptomyces sp. GESEQ-35]|uniref:hypothetical protein n=1 Tax=Streptomyces sp. GESEQ-35 TaxID=2812657 RepID=UPI001B321EF0|nr:hypothetical protein [Streptomyces sp. GESEQ-35]